MVYKMPLRREKAAKRLASALKVHGVLIADKLEPRMAAVLEEGEDAPALDDFSRHLDQLGNRSEDEVERGRSGGGETLIAFVQCSWSCGGGGLPGGSEAKAG